MTGQNKSPTIGIVSTSSNGCPDIVLVNTPSFDYSEITHHPYSCLPPIGLGYLATWLQNKGFSVELIDAEYEGLTPEQIGDRVNAKKPRVIGLNILTPTYKLTHRILERLTPKITVIAGGPHVQAMPREILTDPAMRKISYVVCGDGEFKLLALLQAFGSARDIPGVGYRADRNIVLNADEPCNPRWNPVDLDTLPFLDRRFLPMDPFWSENRLEANLLASRGCPFKCSFCAGSSEMQYRHPMRRSVANIIAELQHLKDIFGVTSVRFLDDLFFSSKKFIREFLSALRDSGLSNRIIWHATARVDLLIRASPGFLDMLSESGCHQLSIGIESASIRVQRHIKKGVKPDDARKVVRMLAEHNIRASGYFVIGFPGETEKEIHATISLFHELRKISADILGTSSLALFRGNIFQFLPYPNTLEWRRLVLGGYSQSELLGSYSPSLMDSPLDERMRRRWSTTLQLSALQPDTLHGLIWDALLAQHDQLQDADALPDFAWNQVASFSK